jgi:putative ABC transport system permease protein
MYSVIAGVDLTDQPPFGPFEFPDSSLRTNGTELRNDESAERPGVILNDWIAEDTGAGVGDVIRVKYHVVGDRGELPEEELEFKVAGIVTLDGPAADPGFTPNVPGVTDADSYDDWREPFPLKRTRITDRDDEYWEEHRTTPKLFVSLETAQDLWRSRYGDLTSVRIAPREGQSLDELATEFEQRLLADLSPAVTGMAVQPVKHLGLEAAQGTTDFTGLFIGFSFFLILAATVLVSLLFRLGIEQRTAEFGLLTAVGLTPARVRRLFLLEGGLLVILGGLAGMAAAVGYAAVMIHGLRTWWFGAIGTRFLYLSVCPLSLLIGMAVSTIVALGVIWWAVRQTRGHSTRSLLSGELEESAAAQLRRSRIASGLSASTLLGSALLLVLTLTGIIPETEAFSGFSWRVVMFFLIGIGLLTGSLSLLAAVLGSNETVPVRGTGTSGRLRLGLRNAARNRNRSVMTASLIASATFVIVAVGAGQQNPVEEEPRPQSGNGGFTLVAETNIPILHDLNTRSGRSQLGFNVLDEEQMQLLDAARVMPFRVRPGEDASCLNLYQTQLPTILGVPRDVLEVLAEERRFRFANTPGEKPWWRLHDSSLRIGDEVRNDESDAVPVFGDMDTLMYSLHKGMGDRIFIPDEEDPEHVLEIAGMFAGSIFQGVLVMSERNFQRLFPEEAGFRYFLIEVDPDQADEVARILEANLGDYGFDAERVSVRLASFLAVQNTYLSTFQSLGGLGLLLGTIGLATVMLRNVLERRGELALLRAVGFRGGQIAALVAWENAFLLLCGLTAGTVSALLAMSPHLASAGADVPWGGLALMLAAVFAVGMLSALAAVRSAVATPILTTLRGD